MKSLFIGHIYIDITFITDTIPTGDDKVVADDYSYGMGGNSVVAAFTCAKLGLSPDLLIPIPTDSLGEMISLKCKNAGVHVLPRRVQKASLALVHPQNGKRAVVRCRDADYDADYPKVNATDYDVLHVDGHQMSVAVEYAKAFRKAGKLTSLDGGAVRPGIEELIPHIDVAVVSMRFCEQLKLSPEETLNWLLARGVKVPAVTLGDEGVIFVEAGKIEKLEAIPVVKEKVIDSTGAGDIFHGAYLYSYMKAPKQSWREHFKFARAASAISVQRLGTEASIPTLPEIEQLAAEYRNLP